MVCLCVGAALSRVDGRTLSINLIHSILWVCEWKCVSGWVCVCGWMIYEWMSVWVDECVSVCVGGWVCVYSVSNSAWVAKYVLGVSLVSCYIMLTCDSMYMLYSRAYQGHALLSVHNSKHVTLHVQTQSLAHLYKCYINWSCCNNNVTADESVCNRPVYVDYWYGLADYGHGTFTVISHVHVTLLCTQCFYAGIGGCYYNTLGIIGD